MGREDELLQLFPEEFRSTYHQAALRMEQLQEIRLRVGQPLTASGRGKEYFLAYNGDILYESTAAFRPDRTYMDKVLNHICGYSVYAFEEEIKKGFLTVPGGHRIGLAGEVVMQDGQVTTMKHLNAMNIRISHQIKGAADSVLSYVFQNGQIKNTLIISPPGCGKTTLLRDLIRQISEGDKVRCGRPGMTVGVVDERSELGGSFCGEIQNDLGPRTDLLDGCPKLLGMTMLLRSMNPQVIAVDEIGTGQDAEAIGQALRSGCSVIATVHGNSVAEIAKRSGIGTLVRERAFTRYILLQNRKRPGCIERIVNEDGQELKMDETGGSNTFDCRQYGNGTLDGGGT